MYDEKQPATCETCPFWKKRPDRARPIHAPQTFIVREGVCKRHGPTATMDPMDYGVWPRVEPADSCGEHPDRPDATTAQTAFIVLGIVGLGVVNCAILLTMWYGSTP